MKKFIAGLIAGLILAPTAAVAHELCTPQHHEHGAEAPALPPAAEPAIPSYLAADREDFRSTIDGCTRPYFRGNVGLLDDAYLVFEDIRLELRGFRHTHIERSNTDDGTGWEWIPGAYRGVHRGRGPSAYFRFAGEEHWHFKTGRGPLSEYDHEEPHNRGDARIYDNGFRKLFDC